MGAYYCAAVSKFVAEDPKKVIGELAHGESADVFFAHFRTETEAWAHEVRLLVQCLNDAMGLMSSARDWSLLLEYPIPRRGKRIDAVVLARDIILVLEFKTGGQVYSRASLRQAEDYALELSDFHAQSRDRTIIPILVTTGSLGARAQHPWVAADRAQQPIACSADLLAATLVDSFRLHSNPKATAIDAAAWNRSEYRPVPTIIEAAELLYAGHSVREIAHSHADAKNLTQTTDALLQAIVEAESSRQKTICFVTGVPGAGKTLAGLNVVHRKELRKDGRPSASFLSGNGPLVRIVSEALVRDHANRHAVSRSAARHKVAKIENVHSFIRTHFDDPERRPSYNRVVVFDEAQRAWNREQQKRKFKRDMSEPSVMLSIMDRHEWAVIIALVGGGQEIYSGEAGLVEWGRALCTTFRHWRIVASPEAIRGGPSVAGSTLFDGNPPSGVSLVLSDAMHLPVSTRAHRNQDASAVNDWVNAVITGSAAQARAAAARMTKFPLRLTRSLRIARAWLSSARGLKRPGLVTSSGALRLRAFGIEVSSGFTNGFPWEEWFLADPDDIRSSYQLEVAATEFQCQGLELDVVGLCWGNDMTWDARRGAWLLRRFRGATWQKVHKPESREYLLNAYRVLLTRAREGLVVWVPKVGRDDPTIDPDMLDATAEFLRACGIQSLDDS